MSMKAEVIKVIQETHDTKTLRLKLGKKIDFIPGQFLMVWLNIKDGGQEKLIKRAYSISSSPKSEHVDITFNVYPEGKLTPHLYKLKAGDFLDAEGPYGKFVFDETRPEKIVLLGAGTGVAPLMSIIRYMKNKDPAKEQTLLYSVKTPEDIIYHQELKDLESSGNLNLFLTVTRSEWDGRTGRINKSLIQEAVPDLDNSIFYICGSPGMVESMVSILQELGVDKDRVRKEQW